MLMLGATMGILVALDLVLLFTFWELAILAAFLLVASSGSPDRVRRAQGGVKVAVFGAFGSVLLLSAILLLYRHSDRTFLVDGTTTLQSFSIPELARVAYLKKGILVAGVPFVKVVFTLLLLGFGVLVPIFPLHTWLPDALATAPTSGAVILAGALLGAGPYAILRVAVTILPEASRWAAGGVVLLGVVNVFYGGLCAMAQRDLRRMLAYGAMSHMGFCLVGIGSLTPQGMMGALVQVFAQGTIVALLFVLVGVLEARTETSDLTRFGGLARETPVLAGLFALGLAASMGLPALAGFWGELLAILGAFPTQRGLALAAAVALLLHVAYHTTAIARLLFGAFPEAWRARARLEPTGGKLPEIGSREIAAVAPLAVLTVVLGIWPAPLLSLISGGVRDLDSVVNPPGPEQLAYLPRGCKGARYAEKPPT
jgi:NADH-quinone oxidoreductase subunit M